MVLDIFWTFGYHDRGEEQSRYDNFKLVEGELVEFSKRQRQRDFRSRMVRGGGRDAQRPFLHNVVTCVQVTFIIMFYYIFVLPPPPPPPPIL
jgi:hypothetical protein